MKINVAQRELIFKGNKIVKDKKISNISIGKNNDDYLNKGKTLNYDKIVQLIYSIDKINRETEILNRKFVIVNKNRAKIVLNNKQYNLKTKIENKNVKILLKIKMKFLDNIINLDSMFKGCEMLTLVKNFSNFNSK